MAFNTFSGLQTRGPLQFIQYGGPPKPKQPSQQHPSKIPLSAECGDQESLTVTQDTVKSSNTTWLGSY
jgi:hypothetical protein